MPGPLLIGFVRCRRAVSAIEFAIVFPVLLILMLSGFQLVLYVNATRKVAQVATSVSEMISQAAPPSGSTTATVNALDVHFSYDAALVIFPYAMKDALARGMAWYQDLQINYASVKFTQVGQRNQCNNQADQSACYTASVDWTSAGTAGGNYRQCTVPQTAVDDSSATSRTTLPRSLFGPGSIIAIDVVFTFVPSFGAGFLPALTIRRSVFVQPRYAALIKYDANNNDGIATSCS